jgi:transcription antitermination factor NusG
MPYWACARVQPQREAFAAGHLEARGFQVFLPKIETRRTVEPLFRGYVFLQIVDRWRAAERTFGVLCLVRVGDCPARCPEAEIEALRGRMDSTGIIRLPDRRGSPIKRQIAIGAKVRIVSGPFGGWEGLYAGMGARDRERVLLSLLGRQTPVLLAANLVVPQ